MRCALAVLALIMAPLPARAEPALPEARPAVRVLIAGSLRGAMAQAIARWQAAHPDVPVALRAGPAGWLKDRILAGEGFDLFIPAALPHAEAVRSAGRARSAVLFVRNRLCATVRTKDGPATEDILAYLLAPTTRIGTSAPVSDPGGDYTYAWYHTLEASHPGAEASLKARSRVLYGKPPAPGERPVDMTGLIAAGEIDAGIGYCSGVAEADDAPTRKRPLPPSAPIADYGLAVATGAGADALAFARFLYDPQAQAILRDQHFLPLSPAERARALAHLAEQRRPQ